MDVSPWDALFWGALLLGGIALIWHVVTDKGEAKAKHEQALQQRLASYPASARAVIIRARPRTWRMWMPWLVLGVALAWGLPYLQHHGFQRLCEHIGPASTLRWIWFLFFPGLPLLFLLPAAVAMTRALRILRGGYAPPLDSAPAQDTIAVSGWRARLRGMTNLILMPVLAGVLAYLCHNLRMTFEADGATASQITSCTALQRPGRSAP